MSDLPSASLDWLATHHGVITAAVLRTHEVSRFTTERLVRAGVLRRASPGVFVSVASATTLQQRCAVLCAIHAGGFVTGPTAGSMASLRRMPISAPLHFSVRHGIHILPTPGVRWRQTTTIADHDRRRRDDGIVVASWARLAFDLAADLRQLDLLSVLHQLLDERKVSADELVAVDRRLGHPARPGSGVFHRSLTALGSHAPNDSHAEVVLAEALRRRDVPVMHQTEVAAGAAGRSLHIDLAVPALKWGVELDIHPEHRSIKGQTSDAGRRRTLHRQAWQIETVTEADMTDVEQIADELAGLFALRRRHWLEHPSTG